MPVAAFAESASSAAPSPAPTRAQAPVRNCLRVDSIANCYTAGLFVHTEELPIRFDVEFAETEAGTLVSAEVHGRHGVGIQLRQVLVPDKYEAAGQAAIAEAFKGITS